jgi:hypothetical protein
MARWCHYGSPLDGPPGKDEAHYDYAQKIVDFYCWRRHEYHWKTHPHCRAQKRRRARRKTARAEAEQHLEDQR